MTYNFSIQEILLDKLGSIKIDVFEDPLFKKTMILLDIWVTQKHLMYLINEFDNLSKGSNSSNNKTGLNNVNKTSYKEQYISFLMKNNLLFLEEVKESKILLNLIYYWLLTEVKHNRNMLNKI